MKEFTTEELAKCNGKNGNPAYVGYLGKVYDVSDSFLWKSGVHQVLHSAGADLIKALEQAPHGEDIIKRFPLVGILRTTGKSEMQPEP